MVEKAADADTRVLFSLNWGWKCLLAEFVRPTNTCGAGGGRDSSPFGGSERNTTLPERLLLFVVDSQGGPAELKEGAKGSAAVGQHHVRAHAPCPTRGYLAGMFVWCRSSGVGAIAPSFHDVLLLCLVPSPS